MPDNWLNLDNYIPETSGWYLCYAPKPARAFVFWFDAAHEHFETSRFVSHWTYLQPNPVQS